MWDKTRDIYFFFNSYDFPHPLSRPSYLGLVRSRHTLPTCPPAWRKIKWQERYAGSVLRCVLLFFEPVTCIDIFQEYFTTTGTVIGKVILSHFQRFNPGEDWSIGHMILVEIHNTNTTAKTPQLRQHIWVTWYSKLSYTTGREYNRE